MYKINIVVTEEQVHLSKTKRRYKLTKQKPQILFKNPQKWGLKNMVGRLLLANYTAIEDIPE